MEIVSLGEAPLDVVDLGDLSAPSSPAGDLEVIDAPGFGGELTVVLPGAAVEEPPKKKTWKDDGDHESFLPEFEAELEKIPAHSGNTTVGCERAIAALKAKDAELSRAIRTDLDGKVDEMRAEALREKIHEMIARLEEKQANLAEARSKRHRKKAYVRVGKQVVARMHDGNDIQYYVEVARGDEAELLPVSLAEPTDEQVQLFVKGEVEDGLTKEAGTAKVYLFEDPFLHAITRILINAHTSAGRNIEEVYAKLKDKYAFTPREELSVQELLMQKGMPIFKDFGRMGEKETWFADGKGVEDNTTYHS